MPAFVGETGCESVKLTGLSLWLKNGALWWVVYNSKNPDKLLQKCHVCQPRIFNRPLISIGGIERSKQSVDQSEILSQAELDVQSGGFFR